MTDLTILAHVLARLSVAVGLALLSVGGVLFLRHGVLPRLQARADHKVRRALIANRRPMPRAIAWLLP